MGETAKGRLGESRVEDLERLAPLFAVSPIRRFALSLLAPSSSTDTEY